MKKPLLAILLLSVSASALQPRDVVRQVAAGMNLIRSAEPACARMNKALAAEWYPANPNSELKFIVGESYRKPQELEMTRTLVDLYMLAAGARAYNAWDGSVRMFLHPQTPKYIYYVGIHPEGTDSPYEYRTSVCLAVIGIRK